MPNSSNSLALQFCTYQPDMASRRKQIERRIQQIAEVLVDETVCDRHDAWARYFLLMFQLWQSPETATCSHLADIVHQWRSLNEANADLPAIHDHVWAQHNHPKAQPFFANPQDQCSHFLIYYLDPKCIAAARRWFANPEEGLSIAREKLLDLDCLLCDFDFARDNTSIRAYAEPRLSGKIRDRRLKVEGSDKRYTSGYALLRYCSKLHVSYALQCIGMNNSDVKRVRLVLKSFNEVYVNKQEGKKALPPPNDTQIQAICDRCNERRGTLALAAEFTPSDIWITLETTIDALKKHQLPTYREVSIDAPLKHYLDSEKEEPSLIDKWQSDSNQLDNLELLMLNDVRAHLTGITEDAFQMLSNYEQSLLRLRESLGLVQREIRDFLYPGTKTHQSTVHHHLKKARKNFLQCCVGDLKSSYPDIFAGDQDQDQHIDQLNEKLMQVHLTQYLQVKGKELLSQAVSTLEPESYSKIRQNPADIYMESHDHLTGILDQLKQEFIKAIKQNWSLDFSHAASLHYRLSDFIYEWLNDCLQEY